MNFREVMLIAGAAGSLVLRVGAAGSLTAREIRCEESLHKIFQMAEACSADNGGYIVRMLDRDRQGRMEFWPEKLRPYARDFRDFSCPDNIRHGANAFQKDDLLPAYFYLGDVSFGINGHISGLDAKNASIEKIHNLKEPSYTVYFGDSNTMRLRAIPSAWLKDWAPVHEGGIMQAVMCDGHIERFSSETLGTYEPVEGWNRDSARWKNWKKNLNIEVKK